MVATSNRSLTWQAIALELLRRLAGAPSAISIAQLRTAAGDCDAALLDSGMDCLYFATCDADPPRRRLYQALWNAQQDAAREIIDDLEAHGAHAVVFKGLEACVRYRPAHGLYVSGDIDLLFAGRDLWTVERVMYAHGYARTEYVYPERAWRECDPVDSLRVQATLYELIPFVKQIRVAGVDADGLAAVAALPKKYWHLFEVRDGGLYVAIRFDVHHNVMFQFNVAPLLARTVASALGTGRALSPADHLWFLIHRYYFEVALGSISELRVLAPIAAMVSDPRIDWSLLVRNAIDSKATAPCMYWLTFLRRLGAPGISDDVLAELRSHQRRSERNFGWQLERLLGMTESFPEQLVT